MEEIAFPQIEEQPVMWGYHRELHQAHKHKAIVDRDTGKLFSIVSKDYKLIRHEQAIDELENILYGGDEDLGPPSVSTGFFNDGGRMCRKYGFKKVTVEIGQGDKVHPELLLYNSYDLTWPLIVLLGAFRYVCTNGLVVGKKFHQFRRRHVLELERMDFREQVKTALERFEKQVKTWQKWDTRPLSLETFGAIMKAMKWGKKATEEIEERVYQEGDDYDNQGFPIISLWIFFNILTWYITHETVSLNHRVELEGRLRRAIGYFKGTVRKDDFAGVSSEAAETVS